MVLKRMKYVGYNCFVVYNRIENEIVMLQKMNQDYLNLIKQNGGPLLKIRYKDLVQKIKLYDCKAYPKSIVERNKKILLANLKKYKGILFEEV